MATAKIVITRLTPIAVLVVVLLLSASPALGRPPVGGAPASSLAGRTVPDGTDNEKPMDTATVGRHPTVGIDTVSGKPRTAPRGHVLSELDVRSDRGRTFGHHGSGAFSTDGSPQSGTTGHSASGDFKAGVGCSIQCITSGVAYAHGVGAELRVETDTPAQIWIIVWNDDGYHKMVDSGAKVTAFSHTFDDLEPGTGYQAMAVAEDIDGHTSHAYGSFETLVRNVEVIFVYADVTKKPYGQQPFWMDYRIQGEWHGQPFSYPFMDEDDLLYDPNWLGIGINIITLEDVDQYLDLLVHLRQRDPEPSLCEASPGAADLPMSGSSGLWCLTWATAGFVDGDDDLDAGLAADPYATEHVLERTLQLPGGGALPPGYGEPLNFTVPVTLTVTYE